QREVFIRKVVGKSTKECWLRVPNNLSIVLINYIILVEVMPYWITTCKNRSQSTMCDTIDVILVSSIHAVKSPSIKYSNWLPYLEDMICTVLDITICQQLLR